MKILIMLLACGLAACAGRPTLEELESEALQTGDWTEVERREELLSRINVTSEAECPEGFVMVCFEQGLAVKCTCVRPAGSSRR